MKKIFAIFLTLVMLLPMCLVVQADEAAKKPFYIANWGRVDEGYSNMFYMPQYWSNPNTVKKGTAHVSWGTSDIVALAEKTKEYFDAVPEGARFINFNLPHAAHHNLNEDACILEKTIPVTAGWLETFLAEYSRIGGKLDGLVVDVEYLNIYAYYIERDIATKDPMIYKKIVENPAYATKIRPKLVERGFKFYSPVSDYTPEIYSIHSKAGADYSGCTAIWEAVLKEYSNECITEGCAPLWKYYPNAIVTDYTSKDVDPWLKEISDTGGVVGGGGKIATAGNSSNESFYTVRPNTKFNASGTYNTLPGYNKTVYEINQFGRFKYETYIAKTGYLASDNGNVDWWIAPYVYNKDSRNAYYTETLYHLGMLNPTVFLGYIRPEDCRSDGAMDEDLYQNTLTIANQAMVELTRIVGYADRKPIAVTPTFNGDYVLSGMYSGGKNYWRITPDNTKISLADFKVEATDPTFRVDGETITFPGGKIIADSEILEIGSCGYWIETAANVTPVVTRADDFYRAYPAYLENYESYAEGTEYNYKNALPSDSWEVKKSGGGSGTVVADPADAGKKVLEIKGNYSAKSLKMPANVRAGDTYAKRQAWEVTFTLPADMAADAELVLLNATNEKKKCNDGGFKIAGSKVYYSQNGEYVELAGVTLTGGGKYTLVREMDFTNAEAFTSTYTVYDANGAVLGQAKKVPIETLVLPVYSVGVACTKVTGSGVLLDNFKLYQTSVATDFYLYHNKTGIRITETDKAVSGDVAYRLSYLNTTGTEKSYTVMAAYYDGETKVSEAAMQEIKLAPYHSGVLTGTVENKQEGKTMVVYLKDNNPAEDEADTPNTQPAPAPVDPEGTTALEAPITVTVGEAGTQLWQGAGTGESTGTAQAGQQMNVVATATIDGVEWGKLDNGSWIKLQDTNYNTVKSGNTNEQKDPADGGNTTLIIIIAAAAAVLVVVVVVVVISKKKKKAVPTEETPEEKTEE